MMERESIYSRPSYDYKVIFHPTGEMYISGRIYLTICTCFPPKGCGYTEYFDLTNKNKHKLYHDHSDRFFLNGKKVHWMDKFIIPRDEIIKFPQFNFKQEQAKYYGVNYHQKLRMIHSFNDEWALVRYEHLPIYNTVFKDHIALNHQLSIFQ